MSADSDNREQHRADLAFFGAVTASISHELNNVLSILDQSAGLLGDLLAGAEAGRPIPPEKLAQMSESMQRQTQRGLEIIRRMNAFAHSTDRDKRTCNIGETVTSFVKLCRRWADMKRVTLETGSVPNDVVLEVDPFLLQQWLYLAFTALLTVAGSDDTISFEVTATGEETVVQVIGSGSFDGGERLGKVAQEELAGSFGGRVVFRVENGRVYQSLFLK